MEKKSDRRASRTKRQLKESLMSLILEKGYDAVTVEDITNRADLGRTTFYLHYRDKGELLLESIDVIADDLVRNAVESGILPAAGEPIYWNGDAAPQPVLMVFEHASQNARLWRVVLRGEGAVMAVGRIREIISHSAAQYFEARLQKTHAGGSPHLPVEVVSNYFAGALLGFITWWLEADMPYSAEKMAEMFRNMFFDGEKGMLSDVLLES